MNNAKGNNQYKHIIYYRYTKMDYTIITAWYDVREKENHPMKDDTSNIFFCSMEWYFDSAKLLFEKPFPMVIFTEPRFESIIKRARPPHLHSVTRFIFRDYEELAYYNLFKKYSENHNLNRIQNVTQEKMTALYKFIVNQKVHFVKDVVEMNPFNTTKFAWMDMRLHCVYDMSIEETTQVMSEIPANRVKLMQMTTTEPSDIYGRHDFYSWTRGKCAAGFFGGSREPLLQFCQICKEEFLQAVHEEMAPTDEMIYSYVIAHHRDLFEPYVGEYGDCLRNLLRIRGSIHLAIPFLQKCFDKGWHEYTSRISSGLRKSYVAGDVSFSAEDIHKIWYYGYVGYFWLHQRDICRSLLYEYFDIAKQRPDVAEYIRNLQNFLKNMIEYMEEPPLIEQLMQI